MSDVWARTTAANLLSFVQRKWKEKYVWFSPEEGWHGPPAYSAQWSA